VAAASDASSCPGLLAPMIGAVIALLASTQATARVTMFTPASSASLRTASTVSNIRSCQYRSWYIGPALPSVNRVPSGGGADRSCLPASSPPAIGL
jgi:hypothetical protein